MQKTKETAMKQKFSIKIVVLSILLALLISAGGMDPVRAALQVSQRAGTLPAPIHAWTFNNGLNDSVGTSPAYIYNGAYVSGCRLNLDGSNDSAVVQSGAFSNLTNVTIETWVIWTNSSAWSRRVFDFGNTTAYMTLNTRDVSNGNPSFSITNNGSANQYTAYTSSALPSGTPVHLVVTLDSNHMASVYMNGVLIGGPTDVTLTAASLGTTNQNHLGRGQLGDYMAGSINEFLIYNVVLSDAQVAESYAAGPSMVNCNPLTTTNIATGVTATGAVLNGTINPAGLDTLDISFEYGLDTGYGSTIAAVPAQVSGYADTPVSASLSGLQTGSVHHYRVKAQGGIGTYLGSDLVFIPHVAGVRHVKTSASGAGNCSSWDDACELQTALISAVSGDEIWVAAGTYKPTTSTDRSPAFQLKSSVSVYGGFAGDETHREDRDPVANLTTLSGDIGVGGNNSDNSFHVVTGGAGSILDGFTITAGYATNYSQSSTDGNGGGLFNAASTMTVNNVIFTGNSGVLGGGIYNSGTLVVTDSTFTGNAGISGHGGGIYNTGTLTVRSSIFTGNSGSFGGGIMNSPNGGTCASPSAATIVNSTFSGNSASSGGSGVYNNNGVMTLLFNTITANLAGGVFARNDANTCTKLGSNIIVGNTSYDVRSGYTVTRYYSLDHNVIGVAGMNVDFNLELNLPGDQVNVADPLLGALADNGGPTRTHALLAGSPAIDAGDDTACVAAPVSSLDQRGMTRPRGAHCDAGAYEVEDFTLTYTAGAHGSISGTSPQLVSLGESGTEVTAVADPGYHFVDWGDGVLTASRTDTNVTGGITVTASFASSNQAPTDISLDNSLVAENQPVGTKVGDLSTADLDAGDTHTYSLACSVPGADDGSFAIAGSALNTAAVFNHEAKDTYHICIRTNDAGMLFFEKNFIITVTDVLEIITASLQSIGAQDGYLLESGETTNLGGSMNSTYTTLRLGDDATKKQYRSLLSFATGTPLPDTAIITKVTLRVRKQAVLGGGDPVALFQGFMLDIRNGTFGTSALQVADWHYAAQKAVGPIRPALVGGGWYSFDLTGIRGYINKLATGSGLTQIRLRFKLDDNNNTVANYLSLYSGNAGAAYRPVLVVQYYIP
jgi:hypothetical protein